MRGVAELGVRGVVERGVGVQGALVHRMLCRAWPGALGRVRARARARARDRVRVRVSTRPAARDAGGRASCARSNWSIMPD